MQTQPFYQADWVTQREQDAERAKHDYLCPIMMAAAEKAFWRNHYYMLGHVYKRPRYWLQCHRENAAARIALFFWRDTGMHD